MVPVKFSYEWRFYTFQLFNSLPRYYIADREADRQTDRQIVDFNVENICIGQTDRQTDISTTAGSRGVVIQLQTTDRTSYF